MSFPRIGLVVDGIRHDYYLLYVTCESDPLDMPCKECGARCKNVVSMIQLGFWQDSHLNFNECVECGYHQVIMQDVPFYWETTGNG